MTGTVIDELFVRLALDAAGYVKGAKVATKTNKDMRDDADKTAKDLEAKGKKAASFWTAQKVEFLGFLSVIAGGAAALATLTIKVDGTNAAIGRLSEVTGTTPALLSGLQNLAKQYGSTADAANAAVSSIYNGMAQFSTTGQGNSVMAAMIHMGIKPVGPDGKPLDTTKIVEQAGAWFKGHSMMQDVVLGGALGMSPDFVNALVQSKDIAKTVASQSTVSDTAAKRAEDLVTTEAKLGTAIGQLDTDIANTLTPAITSLTTVLTSIANWFHVKFGGLPPFPGVQPPVIIPGGKTAGTLPGFLDGVLPTDPRGLRNNNPLNLKFDGQDGATADSSGFAVFKTMQAGIDANKHQLMLDQDVHGAKTLSDLITMWAPPGDNDTAGYIKAVSKATGIAAGAQVNLHDPAVMQAIFSAMAIQEGSGPGIYRAIAKELQGTGGAPHAVAAPAIPSFRSISPGSGIPIYGGGALPANVTAFLNHLRPTGARGSAGKSIGPVTIHINGAQNPMATGRAVKGALNTLATQSARGLS